MSGVDLAAILAFINARLDEREAAAKAGGEAMGYDEPVFPDYRTYDGPDQEAADRYLTVFSPRFMLADVAAKRRIVDEFGDAGEWLPANRDDDEPEYAYGRARTLHDVIKLLAAPFAQHPDFDPAWAVEA